MAAFYWKELFLGHLAQRVVDPQAPPTPGHPGLQGAPFQTAKQLSTTASCRRLQPRASTVPFRCCLCCPAQASSLRCAGWVVTLTAASSPCLASRAPLQPGRLQRQPVWPWSWQRPRGQRPTEALGGTRCSAEPGSRPGGTEEAAAWSGGHFCADLGPERPAVLPAPPLGPVACEGLGSVWREELTWIPGHRRDPGLPGEDRLCPRSGQAAWRRPQQSRTVFVSCSCCGRGLPSEEGAARCPPGWLAGLRHFCGKTEPRATCI